jgi:hypothetical protein
MRRRPLLALLPLAAIGFTGSVPCRASAAEPGSWVAFSHGPALSEVQSRRRFDQGSPQSQAWRKRIKANVEFAAMARELYRDRTLVFVARDGLPTYLTLDYLSKDDAQRPAMKVVAYSGNSTVNHPNLGAYFKQLGLTPEHIPQNSSVLLDVAVGSGRTWDKYRELVDPMAPVHVFASWRADGSSLRIGMRHLDARAATMGDLIPLSHQYLEMENIAYPFHSVSAYGDHGAGMTAYAQASSAEEQAASDEWREHARHLLDGKARKLYEKRRVVWRRVKDAVDRGSPLAYFREALSTLGEARPSPSREALARDIVEVGINNMHNISWATTQRLGKETVDRLRASVRAGESIRGVLAEVVGQLEAGEPASSQP